MAERTPIVPIPRVDGALFQAFVDTSIDVWRAHSGEFRCGWDGRSSVSMERAREFALAILDACDWVDAQRKGAANG